MRRFQLHKVEQGTLPITLNASISGLKFFFDVTLGRGELMAKMQSVREDEFDPAQTGTVALVVAF